MIAHIETTDGIRRSAPAEPLKSYAAWVRKDQPSLIKKQDWTSLLRLRHPAIYRDDRKLLDFLLENYKALLRPKHLDYPMYRDRLKYGLQLERKALKQLERTVRNDALFAAISSRSILLVLVASNLREMEAALKQKHRLVELYEQAIEGLGRERGAKGNTALAFLISSIQSIVCERTGKSLSQSTKDVNLVHLLANAVAEGPDWNTVQNKIKEMKGTLKMQKELSDREKAFVV